MTGFVVFFGRHGDSEVEEKLDEIRIAIGALVARRAGEAGFDPVVAVTPDGSAEVAFRSAGAAVEHTRTDPFHYGSELARVVSERALDRVCAIGAGAGALLGVDALRAVRQELEAADALVLSNNYYSADLVAFAPTSARYLAASPPPTSLIAWSSGIRTSRTWTSAWIAERRQRLRPGPPQLTPGVPAAVADGGGEV